MYLRVLCILQRGALREGIPKRSLGTRETEFGNEGKLVGWSEFANSNIQR